ncbi:MAG: tetratricopeptide repeat protein [Acidimicrobiia bacterium]
MADPTESERLEDARTFLVRSLDDLESERAEGNVDEGTYARLHADYTARAARVLHRLEGDAVPPAADEPVVTPRRRVLTIGGLVAFAVVAGLALAYGLGARLPGQTITGNQGVSAAASGVKRQVQDARADVKAHPKDPAAHLALARALMADQDGAGALTEFRDAARLDPSNPEPFAYSGWLIRLQGFPDQGLTLIDKAIQVRPDYPDARFFRGIILLRDQHDPEGAVAEFRKYLVDAPDSPLAAQVRQLLAEAVDAQKSPTSTTTSTTTP